MALSRISRIQRARSLPIILYPRRDKARRQLVLCLLLCTMGIVASLSAFWAGFPAIVLFGLCATVWIAQLRDKGTFLRLDYEGFSMVGAQYQQYPVPWSRVAAFAPVKEQRRLTVGWWYLPEQATPIGDEVDLREFFGVRSHAVLPETYCMKTETLANLMNELLWCYRRTERQMNRVVDGGDD
jgi:hypothetical protein